MILDEIARALELNVWNLLSNFSRKLDPEWLTRDEQQARKRINRTSQTRKTYIYSLICQGSNVEKVIHDRQAMRSFLLDLALNSEVVQLNDNIRGIENDENVPSDNEFETDDKVLAEVEVVEMQSE